LTSNDDILQQITQVLDHIETIALHAATAAEECGASAQEQGANGHDATAGYYFTAAEALTRVTAATSAAELEARTAALHVERTRGHAGADGGTGTANFGGVAPPRPTDRIRENKRKPGHFARVRVTNGAGESVYDYQIESGNQTDQEKMLGRWKGALASHTENRSSRMHGSPHPEIADDPFLDTHPVKSGWTVVFEGTREPCTSCRNAMNRLKKDKGVTVVYKWGDKQWSPS
jgi:hypothetical protein